MTVDDLDVTIHFVQEDAVVSETLALVHKFLHGIKMLMARNYVDNSSGEVEKSLFSDPAPSATGYFACGSPTRCRTSANRESPRSGSSRGSMARNTSW